MRVVQLLVEPTALVEARHQEIDRALLGDTIVATERVGGSDSPRPVIDRLCDLRADLIHVYASSLLPRRLIATLPLPYVSSAVPTPARLPFSFSKVDPPRERLTFERLPESVKQEQFDETLAPREKKPPYIVGSTRRAAVPPEFTAGVYERIRRFRDDVEWREYDGLPTPADLATIDVWVDPALREDDADGGVAEALVSGVSVVASRTRMNLWRTDEGEAAFLSPVGDANSLTHAIAEALFKPELSEPKLAAALMIRDRFDPAERKPRLLAVYRRVIQ